MTEHNSPDKENASESREERINALLDGELDQDESASLKQAATEDHELASNIIEAYQLQRAMEHVQVERAPASLRRKLKKIPAQNRPAYLQPRWAMAFAVVPLVIISVALMRSQEPSVTPGPAVDTELARLEQMKLDQARQDLALAFSYIGQVSDKTSNRIESEVGGEMSKAVAGSIFKTIQHQKFL